MQTPPPGILPVIAVDRTAGKPLYRQLYDGYRQAIVERRLAPGQRLPSTRSLGLELKLSRLPVLNAYEQLVAEGYCESRAGAGTFVARSLPGELPRAVTPVGAGLAAANAGPRPVAARSALLPAAVEPWLKGTGSFSLGDVASENFPHRVWARLAARHCRAPDPAAAGADATLLRYGDAMGYRPLREAIAAYLRTARAVVCDAEQIMVVSGSQHALELSARVLLEPGSPVWIEEPGYWGAQNALTAGGARLVPVPVDIEGLDVAAGIARCPHARAVYATPSHQFPLGVTMSASRRLRLLDWAGRAGAWVIEDDYNSEYRYESQPISALQGLDRDARVVYIGTFSKVISGALRVGYLALPRDLVSPFVAMRRASDICPPTLIQAMLADFLESGQFARHLRRTRELYRERRSTLVNAIRTEIGLPLELMGEQAGMHLVMALPPEIPDLVFARRAAEQGLWTMPLSTFYIGDRAGNGLVLGYGGSGVREIPAAVRRLRLVLESFSGASPTPAVARRRDPGPSVP